MLQLVEHKDADVDPVRDVLEVLKHAFVGHRNQVELGIDDADVVGPCFLGVPRHIHAIFERVIRGIRQDRHASVGGFDRKFDDALAFGNRLVQRFPLQRIDIHPSQLQGLDAVANVELKALFIDCVLGGKRRQRSSPDAFHVRFGVFFCIRFRVFHCTYLHVEPPPARWCFIRSRAIRNGRE